MPDGFGEQRARLLLGQQGDELQEQRQEVRQLAGGRLEAMAAIERDQIRHGLAAISAFPMHMLEEMQRQCAAAIEQSEVALLQLVDVAPGQFSQQGAEGGAQRSRHQALPGQHRRDLAGGGLQGLGRIGDQGRQRPIAAGHYDTSIGVFSFFASKRLKPVLPEQPSPKEKPQEPRSWNASSPVSRCAVGMTNRSS